MSAQWEQALSAYRVARAQELAFDAASWTPAYVAHHDGGPAIPADIDSEMTRLMNERCLREDDLVNIPSPSSAAFAFKYLITHGDGRELDAYDGILEQEAKRFSGTPDWPQSSSAFARAYADYERAFTASRAAPDSDVLSELAAGKADVAIMAQVGSADELAKKIALMKVELRGFAPHDDIYDTLIKDAKRLGGLT